MAVNEDLLMDEYDEEEVDDYDLGLEYGARGVLTTIRQRIGHLDKSIYTAKLNLQEAPAQVNQDVYDALVTMKGWAMMTLGEVALMYNFRWKEKFTGGYYEQVSDEDLGYTTSAEV